MLITFQCDLTVNRSTKYYCKKSIYSRDSVIRHTYGNLLLVRCPGRYLPHPFRITCLSRVMTGLLILVKSKTKRLNENKRNNLNKRQISGGFMVFRERGSQVDWTRVIFGIFPLNGLFFFKYEFIIFTLLLLHSVLEYETGISIKLIFDLGTNRSFFFFVE